MFHLVTVIIQVLAILVALAPFSLTFVESSNNEVVDGINVNQKRHTTVVTTITYFMFTPLSIRS